MNLRCVIVDDDEAFLHAARALLEQDEVTVAGTAGSAAEAVGCVQALRPDVVLIDIRLGEESGFEAARQLTANGQPTALIMISTHAGADYADLIAESPAIGFLPKTELSAAAIRRIPGTDWLSRAAAVARAQRMRTTALSGWSPNSCATRPAHPAAPYASRAMVMARRMWMMLRSSLRCRADANKASAWRVWMLQGYIVGLP